MENLYELMLGDATNPDKMAMAAQALRRREALGTLAALTGDKQLAPWGQSQLQDVGQKTGKMMTARQQGMQVAEQQAAREQRGEQQTLNRALQQQELAQRAQQSRFPRTLGGGRYSVGEDIRRVPGYEDAQAAERAHELELAGLKARSRRQAGMEDWMAKEEIKAKKISSAEWGKISKLINISTAIDRGIPGLGDTDAMSPGLDVAIEGAKKVGLGDVARWAVEAAGWKSDKGRQVKAYLERVKTLLSHEDYGSALTMYEGQSRSEWDFLAAGLSPEEAVTRAKNVNNFLKEQTRLMLRGRTIPGGFQVPEYATQETPVWVPPMDSSTGTINRSGGWTVEEVPGAP